MSNITEFDPVLLRSFLAVAETLSFTLAAKRRGFGQSTISQHISRLEHAVGRPLLLRNTKTVALTPDGEDMAEFARDILASHDRALARFDRSVLRGRVRFGVSEDLVLSRLPEILRAFRAEHPSVELDLTVGLSAQLYAKLDTGQLDLVFAKRKEGDSRGILLWRETLAWLGSADARLDPDLPVPLVVFPGASITRKAAIDALNAAGRSWNVAVTSDSLVGLIGSVRAGFGVTAQSALLAGADLRALSDSIGLPPLPEIGVVVLGRSTPLTSTAAELAKAIVTQTDILRLRLPG